MHGDVAGALADAVGTTLGARPEPLHRRAFVDVRSADHQCALVKCFTCLVGLHTSVRNGALQHLADGLAGRLRCELQHRNGLGRLLATDQVHDAAGLLGRDTDVPRLRLGFHRCPLLSFEVFRMVLWVVDHRLAAATLLVVLLVTLERAGRSELTELVSDHRLGHEHRHVLAAVVHGERVAEHVGHDHRAARPGLDDVLGARVVLDIHLLLKVVVDEGARLEAARHFQRLLSALLASTAATHDELVAFLVRATGTTLGLTPGADRVATTGGLALTTTVRVVDRVHGHTTDGRALALPAHAAGLAPVYVRLLGVADLADGGAAAHVDVADLTGRHAQLGVGPVLGDELHTHPGRAGDLRATTGLELDGVDDRTGRDVAQRQAVAGLDVGAGAVLDRHALLQALGGQDVALLAVGVVQQRDAGGAVRVVLDVSDLGRDAVLVVATEVDDAVGALVPTTLVTGGDAALVVAATLLGQRLDQRLLRRGPGDLDEVSDRRATTARGGRLVLADCHVSSSAPRARSGDRTSEDVDAVTLGQADDRALGVLALAGAGAGTTGLAGSVQRVHGGDLDVEDLLDRDLDLGLVRVGAHQEGVLVGVEEAVALLAHDRRDQYVAVVLVQRAHESSSSACVCSTDSWEPASTKPAASASAAVLNHTSATVASYHWPPGAWNFIESLLPLIS